TLLAVAAGRPAGPGGPAGRRARDPRRRPHSRAPPRRPVVAARGDADARGLRRAGARRHAATRRRRPRGESRQRRAGPPLRGCPPRRRRPAAGRRAVNPNAAGAPPERRRSYRQACSSLKRAPKETTMSVTTGTTTAPYEELSAALRGPLILPGEPGYAEARAVYNAMIDKRPAAIARCADTADVVTCVRFARAHNVDIAVRGGGHNAGGLAVADDALVIDLSGLRSTTVSPQDHTVRVDPGCTWGDVDHATVAFGMATPSGVLASTGVAGLTLGGGLGPLSRRFGLTLGNLPSPDVGLANGALVTAPPAKQTPD